MDNVDTSKELKDGKSLVEHDMKLENIALKHEIDENLPFVSADPKQVQEIFFNLVRNAAQAIKDTGEVVVSASCIDNKVKIADDVSFIYIKYTG